MPQTPTERHILRWMDREALLSVHSISRCVNRFGVYTNGDLANYRYLKDGFNFNVTTVSRCLEMFSRRGYWLNQSYQMHSTIVPAKRLMYSPSRHEQAVYLKQVLKSSEEYSIVQNLRTCTEIHNCCVPIIEIFADHSDKRHFWFVMPALATFDTNWFETEADIHAFGDKLLSALMFLHEKGIAHGMIHEQHIVTNSLAMLEYRKKTTYATGPSIFSSSEPDLYLIDFSFARRVSNSNPHPYQPIVTCEVDICDAGRILFRLYDKLSLPMPVLILWMTHPMAEHRPSARDALTIWRAIPDFQLASETHFLRKRKLWCSKAVICVMMYILTAARLSMRDLLGCWFCLEVAREFIAYMPGPRSGILFLILLILPLVAALWAFRGS